MTIEEALEACRPSKDGVRMAVSFPQRQLIAYRDENGNVDICRIGDENTDGSTRSGGEWVLDREYAETAYQWRPAVV